MHCVEIGATRPLLPFTLGPETALTRIGRLASWATYTLPKRWKHIRTHMPKRWKHIRKHNAKPHRRMSRFMTMPDISPTVSLSTQFFVLAVTRRKLAGLAKHLGEEHRTDDPRNSQHESPCSARLFGKAVHFRATYPRRVIHGLQDVRLPHLPTAELECEAALRRYEVASWQARELAHTRELTR